MSQSWSHRPVIVALLVVLALMALRTSCPGVLRRSYDYQVAVYVDSAPGLPVNGQSVTMRAYRVDDQGNQTGEFQFPPWEAVTGSDGYSSFAFGYDVPTDFWDGHPTEDVKVHVSTTFKGTYYDAYKELFPHGGTTVFDTLSLLCYSGN